MRRVILATGLCLSLLAAGCNSAAPKPATSPDVVGTSPEVARLSQQLAAANQEIDRQRQLLNVFKQKEAQPPAPPPPSVAVGRGDGRFTVLPSVVAPGQRIAIFSDLGEGDIAIYDRTRDLPKPVATFKAPPAHDFAFYKIPADMAPGEYAVGYWGPGGTTGQAVIEVKAH